MNFNKSVFSISVAEESHGYYITAPRPVIEVFLHVLNIINTQGIVRYFRSADTKLDTYANPGFKLNQVRNLVLPTLYIASCWLEQDDDILHKLHRLWSVSLEEHIRLSDSAKYTNFEANGLISDTEAFRFVFTSWIYAKAKIALKNHFSDVIGRKGINFELAEERLLQAQAAFNRLEFLKPVDSVLSAEQIRFRIIEANIRCVKLQENFQTMQELVAEIKTYKNSAQQSRDYLLAYIEKNEEANAGNYLLFKQVMNDITRYGAEISDLAKKYDDTESKKIFDRIIFLCPPADKK